MVKKILKYVLVFVVSVVVLFLVMVGSEFISQDSMKDNMESSADFLCEKSCFFSYWKGMPAGNIDRFADAVSLGIAWQSDSDNPFESAMWCSFYVDDSYKTDEHHANLDLRKAVDQNLDGTLQYLRYWHGNVPVIRLFHLFTDIKGMYIILGTVMSGLFLALLILLWKHRLKHVAIGLIISGLVISIWFVPFSLEYTWVFLIMLVASIIALFLCINGKREQIGYLFLLTGVITNYLDFLTTETITLLVPLLIVVAFYAKEEGVVPVSQSIKNSVLWLVGYLGAWIMKWVIASVVLGVDVMPYVSGHIAERIGTAGFEDVSILSSIGRNILGLIPTTFGKIGVVVSVFLILAWLCALFVNKKDSIRKGYIYLYMVIGLIPIVRYIVLKGHSYVHFTFTYRALMATVFAMCLITCEVFDFSIFRRNEHG